MPDRRRPLDLDPTRLGPRPPIWRAAKAVPRGVEREHPDPFRLGWFATTGSAFPDAVRRWPEIVGTDLRLRVHAEREWHEAGEGDRRIVSIGAAVDTSRADSSMASILARLLTSMRRGGEDALIREAAYLGGRFLILVADGPRLLVVPDTAATIPAYWYAGSGILTLSSHAALVAAATGRTLDSELRAVLAAARLESPYVVYPPGVRGYHRDVRPVLANHVLRWKGGTAAHERFYPFADTILGADGYERFAEHFATQVRLIAAPRPLAVALTGGKDSQASFAAACRERPDGLTAWTWLHEVDPPETEVADAGAASASARRVGVPHHILGVAPRSSDRGFRRALSSTFPGATQDSRLAEAAWRAIPLDTVSLLSFIAEAGTGFYRVRTDAPMDARRVARVYSSREIGATRFAIEAFAEFIEYADFRPESFGPWDPHDLLYWEHRLSIWAASRVQELELGHRIELPFNSRHVLEGLASATWATRQAKGFLTRFAGPGGPRP